MQKTSERRIRIKKAQKRKLRIWIKPWVVRERIILRRSKQCVRVWRQVRGAHQDPSESQHDMQTRDQSQLENFQNYAKSASLKLRIQAINPGTLELVLSRRRGHTWLVSVFETNRSASYEIAVRKHRFSVGWAQDATRYNESYQLLVSWRAALILK